MPMITDPPRTQTGQVITTSTKYQGPERRERYRLGKDVKILVTKAGSKNSEMGTLKNMTRTGLYFETFGDYQPGMGLSVIYPYDPTKPPDVRPQSADVVRVDDIPGSLKRGVAIRLSNLFLKS